MQYASYLCDVAEPYINGQRVSPALFNHVFLPYSGLLDNVEAVDDSFKNGFLANLFEIYSYELAGWPNDVSDESKSLLEATPAEAWEEADLIIVRKDGSVSTGFHDSDDYNQACEFLLWHQGLVEQYHGVEPFKIWELLRIAQNPSSREALETLVAMGLTSASYLDVSDSLLFNELNKNGGIKHRMAEALISKDDAQMGKVVTDIKNWAQSHL